MQENDIRIGALAEVKVGRNLLQVTIVEHTGHNWKVRSPAGKTFNVSKFVRLLDTPVVPAVTAPALVPDLAPAGPAVPVPTLECAVPTPAAESSAAPLATNAPAPTIAAAEVPCTPPAPFTPLTAEEVEVARQRAESLAVSSAAPAAVPAAAMAAAPAKKLSLMNAALQVLRESGIPMNTRQLVKAVIARGLWKPTDCKTPEQTLYGCFFREIRVAEHPRIRKSAAKKGRFELVPA